MKPTCGRKAARAFTLMELLAIAAVLLVLLVLLLPLHSGPPRPALSVRCMNNLRQIGMALHMFATDKSGGFTPQFMATNALEAQSLDPAGPAFYFSPLRPYLGRSCQLFVCPSDRVKTPCTNETGFADRHVSYFLSLTATPQSTNGILAGDRHLGLSGKPIKPGIFSLASNAPVAWTRELHPLGQVARGSLLFVDAHVEFTGTNLTGVVHRQALAVNQIAIP